MAYRCNVGRDGIDTVRSSKKSRNSAPMQNTKRIVELLFGKLIEDQQQKNWDKFVVENKDELERIIGKTIEPIIIFDAAGHPVAQASDLHSFEIEDTSQEFLDAIEKNLAEPMIYDSSLVDYESPWFHASFAVGEQHRGNIQPVVLPVRTPEMTDVDWASYNEAILMSSCEDPKTVETPRESEDLL